MRITIIPLALFLSAVIFLGSCNPVLAYENDIGQSRIHPAYPLYFLKTIREILELKFAGTSNIRGLRHLEFTQRRIREVTSLVSVNRQELIPPTLENYWFNLGKVSGLLSFKDEALADQVFDQIRRQLIVLQKLYEKVEKQEAKRSIRTAIYRISDWNMKLLDRLDLENRAKIAPKLTISQTLACNFLAKEATSSGLNEVERAVLSERAGNCFKSLRQP